MPAAQNYCVRGRDSRRGAHKLEQGMLVLLRVAWFARLQDLARGAWRGKGAAGGPRRPRGESAARGQVRYATLVGLALLVAACVRPGAAVASTGAAAGAGPGGGATARRLASGDLETTLPFPNGIASAEDGRVWLGSVTSGVILEVSPSGTSRVLTEGDDEIRAGTALRFDEARGRLWGVAPDLFGQPRRRSVVFAVAVATRTRAVKVQLPEGAFANDLVLDGEGGAYVTDSSAPRIWHVDGAGGVATFVEDARLAAAPGQLGLAGITRLPDGALLVGHFSGGELFRVRARPSGPPQVEPLRLARRLVNPDGMIALEDRSVLLCEGDYAGGQGRVLRLVLEGGDGLTAQLEVVRDGLEAPVNLTLAADAVLVSDARIRARMRGDLAAPAPTSFPIVRVALAEAARAPSFDVAGFAHPEGTAEGPEGLIYVSNIGAVMDPLAKDGDGRIDVLDARGFLVRRDAFPGVRLDAPKGMAVAGGRLWIADIDRLVVIELATGTAQAIDLRPAHIGLANDVAKETERSVLVSATDTGALVRVNLDGAVTPVASGLVGANGILVEGTQALVVGLGPLGAPGEGYLFRVDLRSGAWRRLGEVAGRLDGIARLPDGRLLLSDWISIDAPTEGRLLSFDGRAARPWLRAPASLHGPADFLVSRSRPRLILPRTLDGVVTVVPLGRGAR